MSFNNLLRTEGMCPPIILTIIVFIVQFYRRMFASDMFSSESTFRREPLPSYSAEPGRGYEHTSLIHKVSSNVALRI